MIVDFPSGAFPYGVFSQEHRRPRLGVGVGTRIIDLDQAATTGRLTSVDPSLLTTGRLNELLAAGRSSWEALRSELLQKVPTGELGDGREQSGVNMHLAWEVADYVDFYSSRHHAENLGRLFRPNAKPLMPNWLHMPVGYHGRAGTVVVDGTPIVRPSGQRAADGQIEFGPTNRLDMELELGFVLGGPTAMGTPVPIDDAADHVFGAVMLNDWSARDIQAWEYQPLGPFLGKSFATSVSAWVMPLQALEVARVGGVEQVDPTPLDYLQSQTPWHLDLQLEVWMRPKGAEQPSKIAEVSSAEGLYWNAAQQLAHLTVNGASIRAGDLFGTGTISGPEPDQSGSLIELSMGGSQPFQVGGFDRTFLDDGDEIILFGKAVTDHGDIPLGPVSGVIQPGQH